MNPPWLLKLVPCLALGLTAGSGGAATAPTAIKIDSVSSRYALQDFSFAISPETGHAGIRLEYSYPPARLGGDDSDRAPAPRVATLPGLTYDESAHAIVFDDGTSRTTCATEVERTVFFRRTAHMKSSGACMVEARVVNRAVSNGWSTDRIGTLEAWFAVRK
jgi:hypothetical protein